MIKWKSKHRQEDSSNSTATTSLSGNGHELLPKLPEPESFVAPLPPDFVDLGPDVSPQTTPKPSPRLTNLIITKDIEALLEEDERARAQQRQTQQEREAGLSKLDHSSIGGLPAPPRPTLRGRHYKIQSEYIVPMSSGCSPDTVREGNQEVRRPSTTGGGVSSASVSRRASIKDASIEVIQASGTTDAYTMLEGSPVDDGKFVNRLSEFGPKPSRRSSGGPDRESWGSSSDFSGAARSSFATGTFSSTFADMSRTVSPHPSRPLLSHAPVSSRESIYSTVSSVDAPSTVHEPRISVSSTIYPASDYDELPSPVAGPVGSDQLGAGHRDSLFYTEADSVHVDDQQKSIVDTSSPTSAELGTPVPQRTAFSNPLGIYSNSDEPKCNTERAASPRRSLPSSLDGSSRRASVQKPALPTTPKPDFRRSRSAQPPSKTPMISKPSSRSSSPKLPGLVPYHLLTSFSPDAPRDDSLPPTTNYLNPQERADLIRKTRKLTQVFGQTPSPMSAPDDLADSPVLNNCLLPVIPSRKSHPRCAMSIDSLNVRVPNSLHDTRSPMIEADRTDSLSPIRFRRSSSAQDHDSDDSLSPYDSPDAATPLSSRKKGADAAIRSPTIISASDSFIEMTEQHGANLMRFPSLRSLADSITEEQKAEEERRRKRERLAKLHRFLGSRVPMELVLGPGLDVPLPPVASTSRPESASDGEASPATRLWLRGKRRNSLASSDPHERLADSERLKEELSDKEKAIVVKRAQKMERLFGEQPPQDLFHSALTRPALNTATRAVSTSKLLAKSAPSSPSSPVGGNINKSAYRKQKLKRNNRPGTSESSRGLLNSSLDLGEAETLNDGQSDIYYHYRSSLVSLTNIVDNDDKKSLVELHEYINDELSRESRDKRESYSSSIRSERRRSLPLRASYSSLASQYTISETKLEVTPFEVRRRRAAKLSHFFGVSYRDLFGEVLDSLEISVREDEGKGALNADQAKDLLVQLTKLKARRDELS